MHIRPAVPPGSLTGKPTRSYSFRLANRRELVPIGVTNFPNGLNVGNADGATADFQIGGTAVTVSAAQLNTAGGEGVDHPLAHTTTDSKKIAWNTGTVITGSGTVASGLATTETAVASFVSIPGTAACIVTAGTAASGGVVLNTYSALGITAVVAGTVSFIATGT